MSEQSPKRRPSPKLKKKSGVHRVGDILLLVLSLEGVVLALAVLVFRLDILGAFPEMMRYYPVLALAAGVITVWRYQRDRLLVGIVLLVLANLGVWYATGAAVGSAGGVLFESVALLVPLNFLAFAWMDEQWVFTRVGRIRLGIVLLQAALVALVSLTQGIALPASFAIELVPGSWLTWTSLSQPTLLAAAAAISILAVRVVLAPNATNRGLLWSTVSSVLALQSAETATFFFATAVLILTVSAHETAYAREKRDQLTRLLPRNFFEQALHSLRGSFSIAVVDIDHLHTFNARYGRDAGDEALRRIGTLLKHVGRGGTAYRYGGDEFAVIFPKKTVDQVAPRLGRICKKIERKRIAFADKDRPATGLAESESKSGKEKAYLTVSIGIAQKTIHIIDPQEVVGEADQAAYQAKTQGGNRVKARKPRQRAARIG